MTNPTSQIPKLSDLNSSLKVRLNYDTNIIVPYGITLKKKDLMLFCGKLTNTEATGYYKAISLNVFVLGNVSFDDNLLKSDPRYANDFYPESCIDIYYPTKAKIIIGPNAMFYQNNTSKGVAPIYSGVNYTDYLFYPGCELNESNTTANTNILIGPNAMTLYFNRFLKKDDTSEDDTRNENINKLKAIIGNIISYDMFSKHFEGISKKSN